MKKFFVWFQNRQVGPLFDTKVEAVKHGNTHCSGFFRVMSYDEQEHNRRLRMLDLDHWND